MTKITTSRKVIAFEQVGDYIPTETKRSAEAWARNEGYTGLMPVFFDVMKMKYSNAVKAGTFWDNVKNPKKLPNMIHYTRLYLREKGATQVIILGQSYTKEVRILAEKYEDLGFIVNIFLAETRPKAISEARKCALTWGTALGWDFSAPLTRQRPDIYTDTTAIDRFAKPGHKPEYKPSHFADATTSLDFYFTPDGDKEQHLSSSPEAFERAFRTVAPESECKEFFEYFTNLTELCEASKISLAEMLEPDWYIAEDRFEPEYITKFDVETFYDDSFVGENEND